MRQREQRLGMGSATHSGRLVYPITFADGEYFPLEAQQTQQKSLQAWNIPHLAYRDTAGIIELDKQVQSIAQDLVRLLQHAPPWQADWPVVMPTPAAPQAMSLPRFA